MPQNLVTGKDAADVAAFVAASGSEPGPWRPHSRDCKRRTSRALRASPMMRGAAGEADERPV